MCVCVSQGSREPAREWTLCILPRTKNDGMNGDTYSVLSVLFNETAFIACLVIVQRRIQRGFA